MLGTRSVRAWRDFSSGSERGPWKRESERLLFSKDEGHDVVWVYDTLSGDISLYTTMGGHMYLYVGYWRVDDLDRDVSILGMIDSNNNG